MFRLVCPQCANTSYSANEVSYMPCPYCGCKFSGKHGSERRQEERFRKETAIVLTYDGKQLEAKSVDFSRKGLKVEVFNGTKLAAGGAINFLMDGLLITAKIKWVDNLFDKSVAGLERNPESSHSAW